MATYYTKLFNSILDSTIWHEAMPTKVVWITMLAMADKDGCVWSSLPGLADRAKVSREQCEAALERFYEVDPDSRTKEHDGRRVEQIDGGWRLLNHAKYRALMGAEERKEYQRLKQAEYRAKLSLTKDKEDKKPKSYKIKPHPKKDWSKEEIEANQEEVAEQYPHDAEYQKGLQERIEDFAAAPEEKPKVEIPPAKQWPKASIRDITEGD